MFTELMTNTKDHAYNNNSNLFDYSWYIFVHYEDNKISYIFMDNGIGIPTSVKKNFWDKIKNYIIGNQYKYIETALQGKLRTETRQIL